MNTCSVTSVADKKSRQMLHLAKKYNDKVIVIAVGCLVDSLNIKNDKIVDDSDKKESIPGVDYIVSNEEKNNLSNIVSAIFKDKLHIKDEKNSFSNDRIRSFIKIQDGCNQFCSYCLIPYLRGNISSRNDEDIIDEIEVKSKNGVKEIVLTGIHISSFSLDRHNLQYENEGAIDISRHALIDILKKVALVCGIERIRLGSLEPRIINDYFLNEIINDKNLNEKFCANFCLSLQSGCDKTLKNMNRHYTTKDFEEAVILIRKYMPNATLTTDVIVGFPGETDDDFKESLEFVKKIRFYNPNIFPFSKRKGTNAYDMKNQLSNKEKHERSKIMILECEKISKEIEDEYNKINNPILVEEIIEENGIRYGIGYTKEYIKRKVKIN